MSQQECPICKEEVKINPRYPNYICSTCLHTHLMVNGVKVSPSDIDIHNNIEVRCEVKGMACVAREARFGGTVVQPE